MGKQEKMKQMKPTLIALLFLSLVYAANSQKLGILGGMNLASTGGDSENTSMKPAYHIGIQWSNDNLKNFGYSVDATYSKQGANGDPRVLTNFNINNNYINIASLVGYQINNRLQLRMGPQMGVLINGRIKWEDQLDEDTTDYLSFLNFSAVAELAYELLPKLVLYIRYGHGISSNVSNSNPNVGRFPSRVFQLGSAITLKSR